MTELESLIIQAREVRNKNWGKGGVKGVRRRSDEELLKAYIEHGTYQKVSIALQCSQVNVEKRISRLLNKGM